MPHEATCRPEDEHLSISPDAPKYATKATPDGGTVLTTMATVPVSIPTELAYRLLI